MQIHRAMEQMIYRFSLNRLAEMAANELITDTPYRHAKRFT